LNRHPYVLGSVVLTPEAELAERLLGLEGGVPMNPGKVMPLPTSELALGQSRIELILEQLVDALRRLHLAFRGHSHFYIVLQSDSEHLPRLPALLRKLEVRDATVAAVKDAGLQLAAHDVDHAIVKPGPVNALLLQALGAQMMQHVRY
jgi:hypothetical protein